jgi:hypothetical protein
VVIAANLEARDREDRQAVVAPFVHLQVEDREALRREQLRLARLEPGQDLALRPGQRLQLRDERAGPGAGRHHEPLGLVGAAVGLHSHAIAARLPAQHPLARVDLGPERLGGDHVRHDAALRQQEAALRLEYRHQVGRQVVAREPPIDLRPV